MVNLHVKNRARWTGKFVALAAAALLVAPVALAQEATPTAGGAEGDAMVRSMDPSAVPEGFKIPASATHVTNYGVHEWYQNLTKGEADERFSLVVVFQVFGHYENGIVVHLLGAKSRNKCDMVLLRQPPGGHLRNAAAMDGKCGSRISGCQIMPNDVQHGVSLIGNRRLPMGRLDVFLCQFVLLLFIASGPD